MSTVSLSNSSRWLVNVANRVVVWLMVEREIPKCYDPFEEQISRIFEHRLPFGRRGQRPLHRVLD